MKKDDTSEYVKYKDQAEKSWKTGDYVVAVLPLKEEDAKPVYMCGYEDGCRDMKERFRQAMVDWCKDMSVIDNEDINEICDKL